MLKLNQHMLLECRSDAKQSRTMLGFYRSNHVSPLTVKLYAPFNFFIPNFVIKKGESLNKIK